MAENEGLVSRDLAEWPYPVNYGKETEVNSDVLVLGGGLAGCFAAIGAAGKGAKVTIVEKAATIRSGCAGGGMDHFQEMTIRGVTKVSAEQMTKARSQNHDGYFMEDMNLVTAREAWYRLLDLEKMGVKIRDTEDEYKGAIQRDEETKLLFAHDVAARHSIIFWGAGEFGKSRQGMKPLMYKECKRLGVEIFDRVSATSLMTDGGKQRERIIGATGVNTRTGEFYVFKSKATIITTGWVTRLWFYSGSEWRTGWGYQGFSVPANTGDGMTMAYRAGAELVNMESSQPGAPGFGSNSGPIPGVSGLSDKRGDSVWPASVIDSAGKVIPTAFSPYRPQNYNLTVGNQSFYLGPGGLNKWDGEALRELVREGKVKAPLYLDTPSLSEEDRKVIFEVNEVNEGGWAASSKASGEGHDPSRDMVEIQDPYIPRYGREMKWGGAGGGILIDTDANASIKGLYAAGDLTPGSVNATGAAVYGWRAGNNAADYAQGAAEPLMDRKQVEKEKSRVYDHVKQKTGISWRELNLAVKYIMTTYCNKVKNKEMLMEGLSALKEVREQEVPKVYATTPHELMHVLEVLNLIDISEAILHSSLARKASSKALGFYRPDYPEMDPPEWRKWIVIRKDGDGIITSTKPIKRIKEERSCKR